MKGPSCPPPLAGSRRAPAGGPGRSAEAWDQGRVPGALHLPGREIAACAVAELDGGLEYWVREGFPVETAEGTRRSPADPLTAPVGVACGC